MIHIYIYRYMKALEQAHRIECEEQPDDFPCICDSLADREMQEAADAMIYES